MRTPSGAPALGERTQGRTDLEGVQTLLEKVELTALGGREVRWSSVTGHVGSKPPEFRQGGRAALVLVRGCSAGGQSVREAWRAGVCLEGHIVSRTAGDKTRGRQ